MRGVGQRGVGHYFRDWWRSFRSTDPYVQFVLGVFVAVLVLFGLMAYQVEQRNEAIEEIRSAALRIEMAASNTEDVLLDIVAERATPEAIAQNERVQRALQDIEDIKVILCGSVEHDVCGEE